MVNFQECDGSLASSVGSGPVVHQPLLLRAAGAAELCNTSIRTWRTWGTMGRIPRPVYVGRIPFWRYDELRAWVAAGCPDLATWKAMRE